MTLVVVVLVMALLASLVHVIPGDPVKTIMGPRASPELAQIVRHQMELDRPIPVQIWHFVEHAFEGNLGVDFVSDLPVTQLIGNALPHTVVLAVAALALAVLIGVPLGVYAATRPNSLLDRATAVLSVSFITIPSYVGGLLLLLLFSVKFQ